MLYVAATQKVYPGFMKWTVASLLNGIGLICLSLRGILPDFLTIASANVLIVALFVLVARGLVEFAGGEQKIWLDITPIVVLTTTFLYYTYHSPNVSARIVIISLLIALLSGRSALIISKQVPLILFSTNWFLLISFIMLSGWFFLRAILTLSFENHIVDFMRPSVLQGFSVMVVFVGNITIVTGLIIINAQRLEHDLIQAKDQVNSLKGLLPICSSCKKIRDDEGYWHQVEEYVKRHSEAEFSHGICPDCMKRLYPKYYQKYLEKQRPPDL